MSEPTFYDTTPFEYGYSSKEEIIANMNPLLKELIEQNSGKIISNVNKKLDYLIAGDKPTLKKINTAKEWNIKIINQTEWLKMLNKSG